MKKYLKVLILIVLVVALICGVYLIYQQVQKNRFKKLLQENDAINYELVEIINRRRN